MRPVDIGAIYRDARERDLTWQEFLDELGRAIKERTKRMAKWIWPVMIEMPDDYDFDGASDDEKRALQRLNMYVIHDLSNAVRSALRAEGMFHPSQISIGSVMLPGRAYGWDVTGEYQAFSEQLRKELSDPDYGDKNKGGK